MANSDDFWTFTQVRLHASVRTESGNYLLRQKKERGEYIAKEKPIFYVWFPFEDGTGIGSFSIQHGSTAHPSGKWKHYSAQNRLQPPPCTTLFPTSTRWGKNFIRSTQELHISESVFSKWKHMDFSKHRHEKPDNTYHTTYSQVLWHPQSKPVLLKRCIKLSTVLDRQKNFTIAFSGQKLAWIVVS